jgi:two-component system, OmpR family, sensor histidine kinase KdpD
MPGNEPTRRPTPVIGPPLESGDTTGRHKIFLGFAAGTGKTYAMLDEARRRKSRGQDVIIGFVDTHGRKDTNEHIEGLETIPGRKFEIDGKQRTELDVDAIIARHPQLVLVDELQHTNAPGSVRKQRWQDVEVLIAGGINVLSTLDVQHLESLNDQVFDVTGVRFAETVPDRVLKEATEVEMVDATPRALIHRLERGDVVPEEEMSENIQKLFKEGSLSALRELAFRVIAERVDADVLTHGTKAKVERPWAARDRVMICISPTQPSMRLIRRGWRTGQRLHADVVAVYVEEEVPSAKEQQLLKNDFALADRLGIPVVRLKGDVADELIRYARDNKITQLVIGHSSRSRMQEMLRPSIVSALIRELRTIDILVVAADKSHDPGH